MSTIQRLTAKRRFYSDQELYDLRRRMLRVARTFPPGPDRNQSRQIALSLRALSMNPRWLRDRQAEQAVAAAP